MYWKRLVNIGMIVMLSIGVILFCSKMLSGYFINGFTEEDNLFEDKQIEEIVPEKRMVLRLDPITYYTVQVGTFSEIEPTQQIIDELASLGYRPFIKVGPPYKIWLGCFSKEESKLLERQEVVESGQNIFISKNLVNEVALKFPESDKFIGENIASLLGKYNIVMDHSLKMFIDTSYETYPEAIWVGMVQQITDEIKQCIEDIERILIEEESLPYADALNQLKEQSLVYIASLDNLLVSKNDEGVLIAQSYLLELIKEYHEYIEVSNEIMQEKR